MKKIMSMAIVLIALVTLSVSAFAADNGKQISDSGRDFFYGRNRRS